MDHSSSVTWGIAGEVVRRRDRPIALTAATNAAMVAGAALIAWSAAIHLDLWHSSYRSIPTIGRLFLFQSIAGFVLAAVVAGTRRLVPALAGIAFLASTVAGLVLSINVGLFGFKDSLGAAFARLALTVELAGIVVLSAACLARIVSVRRVSAGVVTASAPIERQGTK